MNSISNNFSMSNLQVYYDKNHIHGSMPHDKVNHDMTKMNEMGSKEQMKADCNIEGMHGESIESSVAKNGSTNNAINGNLGININIQV